MQDLVHFWRISRPFNVLITLLAFSLACYLATLKSFYFIEDEQYWWICLTMTIITATGYWVNDAFDFKIDRINKPRKTIVNAHLSVKKVLTAYFAATSVALIISWFTLPLLITGLNTVTIASLFFYAAWFKRISVVGNILVAALTGLVIYYGALLYFFRMSIIWTLIFAIEVTFLREVAKDIEDIRGDLRFKLQTLPIRIGIRGAKNVLAGGYILLVLSTYIPFVWEAVIHKALNWPYLLISLSLVQVPAIWLLTKLIRASRPEDFKQQSQALKWMILTGMLSVLMLN